MALHTPVYMQPAIGDAAIDYSAQEWRQFVRAMMIAGNGIPGQQGVTSGISFQVTQRGAGANFSVDVASGLAFVVGDDVTSQGTYFVWNDATVNVPTPSPGATTQIHRLVLQIQDKLTNPGLWSGYQAALSIVAGTGSGDPQPEPNSAITLALITIAHTDASVQNAAITDMRQRVGSWGIFKPTATPNAGTALIDDPHLQLLNLPANTWMHFDADIEYNGGSGAGEGDLTVHFRTSGISQSHLIRLYNGLTGVAGLNSMVLSDTFTNAQTTGTGNDLPLQIKGTILTGNAPCWAVMQFAQSNSVGTATSLQAGSRITVKPINQ